MANVFLRIVPNIFRFSRLQRCNQIKNTIYRHFSSNSTKYSKLNNDFKVGLFALAGCFMTAAGTIYYMKVDNCKRSFLLSAASKEDEMVEEKTELSLKQIMFEQFASYEFNGKAIMSPKDFLDSLVDNKKPKEGIIVFLFGLDAKFNVLLLHYYCHIVLYRVKFGVHDVLHQSVSVLYHYL